MNSKIHISDQQYNELVLKIGDTIAELQSDDKWKKQVLELLKDIDLLHREALARIVAELEESAPQLLGKLLRDSVIQSLFLLYEFVPQPAEMPEENFGEDGFVPLTQLEVPVWVPAGRLDEFPEGELVSREVNQQNLLLCRIRGEVQVVVNRCIDSILPLELGRLEGETVVCPWHGCRYHLPSGKLEGRDLFLPTFPVQISESGEVRIGFNMTKGSWRE